MAVLALGFSVPTGARAEISGVQEIDGPGAETVEVAAAMAEDGSGGVAYLKKAEGRDHVFAAQFRDGAWEAPERVDVGQKFDSSWVRIAAGDDGRLLVTWVQEFGAGTADRLFSATLDPGARGFQEPVPLDFNVGEATSTFPDLAMNAGGQAYIAYLVITDQSTLNPPGYLGINVRVAHYNNRLWSVLGNPIDRNPAIPMPKPTDATGPKIGIDATGQAVVAWREPDDEFVNRVWARRVFGTTFGIPLQVSPSSWERAPLRGEADAFDLDVAGFGQAAVALRQQPSQGSKLTAPRIFVNEMPDAYSEGASAFQGARLADGGERGALGPPSVAVEPEGGYLAGFGSGSATLIGSGDNSSVGPVRRVDSGASSIGGEPLVDLAGTRAGVAAWREQRGNAGSVAIREERTDGLAEPASLSAPSGGAVGSMVLGGSGLGDAIVAWIQGSGAKSQVAAAVVDAPPNAFLVQAPEGWQDKQKLRVSWNAAENAIGSLRYSIAVDDEPVGKRTKRLHAVIRSRRVGEGRHRLQVFAIDDAGQETPGRTVPLLVDRRPPRVRLRRHGRRVTVLVSDGPPRATSGVKGRSVKVSFGDGSGAGATSHISRSSDKVKHKRPVAIHHAFPAPGAYRVRVTARDRAGNRASLVREVRVP
jgi:hypothetical protein